jgi:hypothetical protein
MGLLCRGGAAIAGRDKHFLNLRGLGQLPCQGMFAAAGANKENLHGIIF